MKLQRVLSSPSKSDRESENLTTGHFSGRLIEDQLKSDRDGKELSAPQHITRNLLSTLTREVGEMKSQQEQRWMDEGIQKGTIHFE